MIIADSITPIPLIVRDANTFIDANWVRINNIPLPLPCSIMRFINICDVGLKISFDGTNEHLFLAPFTLYQFTPQINNMNPSNVALVPKGTVFWAKTVNQPHAPIGFMIIAGYSSYRS